MQNYIHAFFVEECTKMQFWHPLLQFLYLLVIIIQIYCQILKDFWHFVLKEKKYCSYLKSAKMKATERE